MAGGLSTRSAAVLLAGVVLASNWPVTKLIVHHVTPLWATALRCMIAAVALAPLLSIVSATANLGEPIEPSLFLAMTLIIGGIALGTVPGGSLRANPT